MASNNCIKVTFSIYFRWLRLIRLPSTSHISCDEGAGSIMLLLVFRFDLLGTGPREKKKKEEKCLRMREVPRFPPSMILLS